MQTPVRLRSILPRVGFFAIREQTCESSGAIENTIENTIELRRKRRLRRENAGRASKRELYAIVYGKKKRQQPDRNAGLYVIRPLLKTRTTYRAFALRSCSRDIPHFPSSGERKKRDKYPIKGKVEYFCAILYRTVRCIDENGQETRV